MTKAHSRMQRAPHPRAFPTRSEAADARSGQASDTVFAIDGNAFGTKVDEPLTASGRDRHLPALIVIALGILAGCTKPVEPAACSLALGDGVDVAIVTVIAAEYDAALAHMDCNAPVLLPRGRSNNFAWRSARIERSEKPPLNIVVALAGEAGTTSGALAVMQTATTWRPDTLVLAGIAGGFESQVNRGDVVVSTSVWGYDYGAIAAAFEPRRDWTFRPDAGLLRAAVERSGDWQRDIRVVPPELASGEPVNPQLVAGATASGNKVVETLETDFVRQVLKRQPDIASVEMEAAGALAAAELLQQNPNAPAIIMLRGISDIPGETANATAPVVSDNEPIFGDKDDREQWKHYAADSVAAFTVSFLRDLPVEPMRVRRTNLSNDLLLITLNSAICRALQDGLGTDTANSTDTELAQPLAFAWHDELSGSSYKGALVCAEHPVTEGAMANWLKRTSPRAAVLLGTAAGLKKAKPGHVVVARQVWPFGDAANVRPLAAIRHSRALLTAGQSIVGAAATDLSMTVHFGAVASCDSAAGCSHSGIKDIVLAANARSLAMEGDSYGIADHLATMPHARRPLFLSVHGIAAAMSDESDAMAPGESREEAALIASEAQVSQAAQNTADFMLMLMRNAWPVANER